MVENHSPEFIDKDEAQKLDFFEGDVHLGHYDIRFNYDDKKYFSITPDGTCVLRVHTEPGIKKLWLLLEDDQLRPLEISEYASTDRFKFWEVQIEFRSKTAKFSFAATTNDDLNLYFGTSGIANFISPSEKWIFSADEFNRHIIQIGRASCRERV